jgi:PAS domain S-box-containing protein
MPDDEFPDGQDLPRDPRDLAALEALPAVWSASDRRQIAAGMAEVLVNVLALDFAYVRLVASTDGESIEVARSDEGPDALDSTPSIATALARWLASNTANPATCSLPHPRAGGRVNAALTPIGYEGELGVLVAASRQPGFPTDEDRFLCGVVANQAAFVLQRKRADELSSRLAAIVESSYDAIVSKDLDGMITSWNDAAEVIFGYSAQEVVGRHISILMPEDHIEDVTNILARVRRGERVDRYETKRRRKDGTIIDVSITVSPVRNGYGEIIGASKIARDITEEKRVEQQRNESERRKDESLAILAHELRNPLATVLSAVQILIAKGPPEPDLIWPREVIDRQVSQMTRLVDDLLDVSRTARGRIALRKQRVELATVVDHAVETSRAVIEQRGHELVVSLPREPITIEADGARLTQVLQNLLNNAAKYTERGGRIALAASREGESVVIRVADNGAGIPAEMLTKIFEMFVQVDRSLERAMAGLGIGLTLVKRLVELHGGEVEAHSAGPGQGSEFVVRLPVAPEAEGPAHGGQTGAGRPPTPAPRHRILVVDDNHDSADTLAALLRLLGNEVATAYDGLEAVGTAATFRPDVVLLDIGLPKLNGYDAARRIREQHGGRMVLVALTGWSQEQDRRRSKEAGFDHHMIKPVEFEALQKLLRGLPTTTATASG